MILEADEESTSAPRATAGGDGRRLRGIPAVGRGTAGTDAGETRTAAPGAMRLRSADAVEDGWGHVTVPNQQYLGVVGDETPGLLLRA